MNNSYVNFDWLTLVWLREESQLSDFTTYEELWTNIFFVRKKIIIDENVYFF